MGMLMAMTQAKQREEEARKRQNLPLESVPAEKQVEEPVKDAEEQPKRKPVVRHTVKRK